MGRILAWWVLILAMLVAGASTIAQETNERLATGKRLFTDRDCYGCHTVGKVGTPIAPELSWVGFKYTEPYLARWLRDPSVQKPTAHMPKIELTEAEVQALAVYLSSLR